jgi:hypothetical protein
VATNWLQGELQISDCDVSRYGLAELDDIAIDQPCLCMLFFAPPGEK